ncbi:hypothetical protein HS125_16525 [bacterium]|nr:hypothetical protein [bacterium]
MKRSHHLILFYALFAMVFLAAYLMVGAPANAPAAAPSGRLGLLPEVPASPRPPDPWFDHAVSDPALDQHVPALRGVVYSEAIHDMPAAASPQAAPR